jgi:hypothetical protein
MKNTSQANQCFGRDSKLAPSEYECENLRTQRLSRYKYSSIDSKVIVFHVFFYGRKTLSVTDVDESEFC